MTDSAPETSTTNRRWPGWLLAIFALVGAITFGVTALLVTIVERKQEARDPFVRLVEVTEISTDSAPWGINWPHQYDSYRVPVDNTETEHGGSSALPASKLEQQPWLKRLYAGYAFSLDYREARGHAYMLHDQEVTKRVTERSQSGACLHCHASVIPTYRRIGLEAMGKPADAAALAENFNWPAVMRGFQEMSTIPYEEAHAALEQTPDGTPEDDGPHDGAHPVGCIDCHNPESMELRVTRPGFVLGIAALAESDAAVPHLPSIETWRSGDRSQPYDPNIDATRQEMRSFVCGQCHVEYYCAAKERLFFPWENGLLAEQIEQTYEAHTFPDGSEFMDYKHGETGAPTFKAQHPEFELWSQGIHARSGVSCADCHMPYESLGAKKVSSHQVQSPLLTINRSCQVCHKVPEEELRARTKAIQARTMQLMDRAANAMTQMLDSIREAQAAGASDEELAPILKLQNKATWRLDYISSENSKGFHADQEAARLLGESIDYSRQAQVQALQLRAAEVTGEAPPIEPVRGITPAERPEDGPR